MRRFAISSLERRRPAPIRASRCWIFQPAGAARRSARWRCVTSICQALIPTTSRALRQAIQSAGIELYSVLIDTGDIAAPGAEQRAADIQTIGDWIGIAAALGAGVVRISAGQQPPSPEVIERSGQQLHAFAQLAARHGVRVITENWQRTSQESRRSAGHPGALRGAGRAMCRHRQRRGHRRQIRHAGPAAAPGLVGAFQGAVWRRRPDRGRRSRSLRRADRAGQV